MDGTRFRLFVIVWMGNVPLVTLVLSPLIYINNEEFENGETQASIIL